MLSRKKAKQNMEAYRSGFLPSEANANPWERLPSARYGSVSKWFSAEQSERQPLREASISKIWKRIEVVITARTRNAVTEQSVQGFESLRFRQRTCTCKSVGLFWWLRDENPWVRRLRQPRGLPWEFRLYPSLANGWRHPFGRKRKQFTQGELLFFFSCWCASLSYRKSDY